MPENPHPLLRDLYGSSAHVPPAIEYPIVLPGQPFSWSDILHNIRKLVSPQEFALYQSNPESLSQHMFTASGDMGDEAFRVSSFLTIGKEKLLYLVFADQGAVAVAYSSSDLFTLLESSMRVITEGS